MFCRLQLNSFFQFSISIFALLHPLPSVPFLPFTLSPHRWSPQSWPPLLLDICRTLWRGKKQYLPCAGWGDGRVDTLIAGAGDDHYLVVLAQVDTARVQQSLKVGQKVLGCLA